MYPSSDSEFGSTGYKSCFLTWHRDDSDNMGFYVEPLPYCQDDSFYKSYFHYYRNGEDDVIDHGDPSYQELSPTRNASGSTNLLGGYFSQFVWDQYKFSEGYDAFNDGFNGSEMVKDSCDVVGWDIYKFSEGYDGLNMVKDPCRDTELYENYGKFDNERETQFRVEHIPWFDCDFGFQYTADEDNSAAKLKSKYSQSWESLEEMGLYEKIFGNCHDMLRSDTESRVEAGLA